MPSNPQKEAIQSRLRALLEAVYEEALRSPEFFETLERILVSPEAKIAIQKKASAPPDRHSFNSLELLHREGESGLRRELENRTNDDLAKLCAGEGIKKFKEAKNLERGELINLLIQTSTNRLKQGESFTKKNPEERTSPA